MPLKVSHGIGAWIKDFQKSDAPQFKGKSDKERRDQAIAAYLSAKRGDQKEAKESPPFDGPYKKKQSVVPGKHGEGPSTAKHLAKMGMKQSEKKPVKESYEKYKVGDFVKHDGKIHRVFGVNGTTLHTGTYYGKDKYGGTNRLHVSKVTKAPTPKGEGVEQTEQFSEKTTFEVEVEGLPTMYVKAKSPGEVKANLRKIVKQPSMITGVSRVTDADMKKVFRDKAQGRDEVEEGTGKIDELKKSTLGSYIKKAHQSKSFTAADIGRMGSRGDTSGDEYKKIKDKHKNRSVGIDRAVNRLTKEEAEQIDEISKATKLSYYTKATTGRRRPQDYEKQSKADAQRMKDDPENPAWKKRKDHWDNKADKRRQGIDKAKAALTKEEVNEISGELAQRYHDKAVKAPAPKDKKDPLKHTIKRFASMQKAQDIIHKSELKRIGGQK